MCKWVRETASGRLKVTLWPVFQDKFSYIMAVRGMLGRDSVMVRRMRSFAVTTEMDRGGVSEVSAAAFASSLPGMLL